MKPEPGLLPAGFLIDALLLVAYLLVAAAAFLTVKTIKYLKRK
jgi:hypothetical protein